MEKIKLPNMKCLRCGWTWTPRVEEVIICPHCKSPYFSRPRKNKLKTNKKNDKET